MTHYRNRFTTISVKVNILLKKATLGKKVNQNQLKNSHRLSPLNQILDNGLLNSPSRKINIAWIVYLTVTVELFTCSLPNVLGSTAVSPLNGTSLTSTNWTTWQMSRIERFLSPETETYFSSLRLMPSFIRNKIIASHVYSGA